MSIFIESGSGEPEVNFVRDSLYNFHIASTGCSRDEATANELSKTQNSFCKYVGCESQHGVTVDERMFKVDA
jgi:hypothetical protein